LLLLLLLFLLVVGWLLVVGSMGRKKDKLKQSKKDKKKAKKASSITMADDECDVHVDVAPETSTTTTTTSMSDFYAETLTSTKKSKKRKRDTIDTTDTTSSSNTTNQAVVDGDGDIQHEAKRLKATPISQSAPSLQTTTTSTVVIPSSPVAVPVSPSALLPTPPATLMMGGAGLLPTPPTPPLTPQHLTNRRVISASDLYRFGNVCQSSLSLSLSLCMCVSLLYCNITTSLICTLPIVWCLVCDSRVAYGPSSSKFVVYSNKGIDRCRAVIVVVRLLIIHMRYQDIQGLVQWIFGVGTNPGWIFIRV
jgi:hypothetical protein